MRDASASSAVVGEQGGQAQPPRQVERRLHRLAHTRRPLVRAQQVDDGAVPIASYPSRERHDLLAQPGFGRGSDPRRQCGADQRAREQAEDQRDDGFGVGLGYRLRLLA